MRRAKPDWDLVEREYRLGQLSIRQIADKYGVAVSTVVRRANKGAWVRDLAEQVRVATEARLASETAKAHDTQAVVQERAQERVYEAYTGIAVAAEANTAIVMRHRQDIVRLRNIFSETADELQSVSGKAVEIGCLINAVVEQSGDVALGAVLSKALSLKSRTESLDKLASVLTKCVTLERQAFGIDKTANQGHTIEDLLLRAVRQAPPAD